MNIKQIYNNKIKYIPIINNSKPITVLFCIMIRINNLNSTAIAQIPHNEQ